VATELQNSSWIRNLGVIDNPDVLEEFTLLYIALSTVVLNDQRDQIIWRWTSNGQYTAALAYNCQFIGAMTSFPAKDIWKAIAESKCKFFAWLVLHNRAQTVDNLLKKNWHGATECSLCLCHEEAATNLLTQCNFTEALWNLVANCFNLPSFADMRFKQGPIEWANSLLASGNNKDRRKKIGILFCLW
jgi:hypothetical protein